MILLGCEARKNMSSDGFLAIATRPEFWMKALIDHLNVTDLKVVASCGAAENIVKESTRTAC